MRKMQIKEQKLRVMEMDQVLKELHQMQLLHLLVIQKVVKLQLISLLLKVMRPKTKRKSLKNIVIRFQM